MKTSGLLACALALAAALAALPATAQAPTGSFTVDSVVGELRAGATALTQGARGGPSTLTTGRQSRAVLLFDDGMTVFLDENTSFRVVAFNSGATGEGAHVVMDLVGGAARFTTGQIVRKDPHQFFLRTPQAAIGVGQPTDFSVAVLDGTYVSVAQGSVVITNAVGALTLGAGGKGAIASRTAVPADLSSSSVPATAAAAFERLGSPVSAASPTSPATAAAPMAASAEAAPRAGPSESMQARRFWIGVSAGQSTIDREATAKLIDTGTVDESSTGYKVFAGFQLHRFVAAEVAYVDLGKLSYEGSFGGAPVTDGKLTLRGFNLAALGTLPMGERFTVFGKVGVFAWTSEASDTTGGTAFSHKTTGHGPSLGLGAIYAVIPPLAIRVEVETFKFGDSHARLLSAGVAYRF